MWKVGRTDDNGWFTVLATGLTEAEALRLVKIMEDRGHKQTYVALPQHHMP